MRRQNLRTLRALGVLATIATIATISTLAPSTPSTAAARKTKTSKVAKAKAPSLSWSRCSGPVECTTLAVPLDYSNPALGTTNVAVGRLLARNAKTRHGVLFVNPGGPGGSAIDLVRSIAEDRNAGRLGEGFDDWDVVGVDPRGVGRSDRIRCGTKLSDLGINPFATPSSEDRSRVRNAWLETCATLSGGLILHAGTIAVADDMDRVRVALGEDQIDYLGYSYGTVLGAVYAARHGGHVRSMVLDAAVDPSLYGSASFLVGAAAGMERRVRDFSVSCSASEKCALRTTTRQSAEQISQSIDNTLRQLETKTSTETAARVRSSVYAMLEESANWAQAAAYVSRLEKIVETDLSGAMTITSPVFELLTGNAAYWAVNCADGAFPNNAPDFTAATSTVQRDSPIVGSVMLYLADLCVDWPEARPLGDLSAKTARPILVIGGLRDTRTPIEWSQGLVTRLGNARLIVRDGDGHASYPRSACIRRAVDVYLKSNTLPADGTVCG